MNRAVIDIGTNSVKLLVARIEDGRLAERLDEQVIVTRLGQGIGQGDRILPEAEARTLSVLQKLVEDARSLGAGAVVAVGTRVFRAAENGKDVAESFQTALQIPVAIITGEREAQLGFAGAVGATFHAPPVTGPAWVLDIGGGSSELAFGDGVLKWSESVNTGTVALQESIREVIWTDEICERARTEVAEMYRDALSGRTAADADALIGIGGTVANLTQIEHNIDPFDPAALENLEISSSAIAKAMRELSAMEPAKRLEFPGVVKGREDVLPAGAAIVLGVMDALGRDHMTFRTAGIRHTLLQESVAEAGDN